jgi:hypothetical protein
MNRAKRFHTSTFDILAVGHDFSVIGYSAVQNISRMVTIPDIGAYGKPLI